MGAQVVGQVGAISTRDFQADLTLDIKKSVRLPVGTIAQVRFDDPLGDEYILLQPPSTPPATTSRRRAVGSSPRGPTYPTARPAPPPASRTPSEPCRWSSTAGGSTSSQTIIGQLNDTFNGNQTPIRSFLTTIDNGVSSLAGGRAAIDAALASISNLSSKLNGGGADHRQRHQTPWPRPSGCWPARTSRSPGC